jgi:hypothetical protein
MRGLVAVLSVVCLLFSASAASADKRVALVIGNGAYANASQLSTPVSDARAMAENLRKAGFEVVPGIDLTREAFNRLLQEFGGKASGADVALVFYAGYAIAVNGRNYLLPVGANPESGRDIPAEAIDVERAVVGAMAGARSKLLVLAANPDNPFASKLRGVSRGLAPMTPGKRTFIAFANSPGETPVAAGDGSKAIDGNSLFTRALIMNMQTPGLNVTEAMNKAGKQVERESAGQQTPWIRETLTDDVSLGPPNAGGSSAAASAGSFPTKIAAEQDPPLAVAQAPASDGKLISREETPAAAGGAPPEPKPPASSVLNGPVRVVKTIRVGPDTQPGATADQAPSDTPAPQPGPAQSATQDSGPSTQKQARTPEKTARNKLINGESLVEVIEALKNKPSTEAPPAADDKKASTAHDKELSAEKIIAALSPRKTRALSISPSSPDAPPTADKEVLALRPRKTRALAPSEREEIAEITEQKPVLDTGDLPNFPWPPPKASASYVLPDELLKNNNTMAEAVQAILSALERTGYVERSFFKTRPGGVALVTQLERIQPDGTPFEERDRWSLDQSNYRSTADLIKFLRGLFFVDPGHYRLIVFILQDTPFVQSGAKITGPEARGLMAKGANVLPAETGKRSFAGSHCTVLVYEFASDGKAVHMVESQLTGKQHLDKAGVLSSLGRPN